MKVVRLVYNIKNKIPDGVVTSMFISFVYILNELVLLFIQNNIVSNLSETVTYLFVKFIISYWEYFA